ncbi:MULTISPECIES: TonB-dependent receptor domain-containing protein [unclassified Pedobacter]|uniref:TonB-dependent receptor domain-containing protein n=1 Tax=Pedobacter TaxID=84567 RepID=UPI000B4B9602|nr:MULTISPECIES: TonB-dependent receptor [unclassified Pedobacter]MCX2432550.1 TonB-dependent receptor [Pedobacter sp. GR22-10]MCX2583361.1 TonB-dependent receptor [Pedobacter sp. MR22-3]OWK72057.1 TonB-dependent receptor [Pedobacter sp. AJM]
MKRILLSLLIFGTFIHANAQFPAGGFGGGAKKPTVFGRITATILDSVTKQPIDYATVSLISAKDNKSVNGGVTDPKGKLSLQNVAPDTYKLMIGFMGYKTKSVTVTTTPAKPDQNLGTIYISSTENSLADVQVQGTKAVIENKIDRMVYNAEADGTNAGGDATDVMRKVPMLSVDVDGNVQLRGGAVRVLINGKPSGTMASSVSDALKMIPAEQIKSVEVITSPSAKYDAEGSGGIINIITKKSNAQGVSGTVNTSVGTRQNNGAFNLTAKTGRLSVNTSLGANLAYAQDSRLLFENITRTDSAGTNRINSIIQNGVSKFSRNGYNGSFGADYDFNAYDNVSSTFKYNNFSNGGPGSADYILNGVPLKNVSNMDVGFNNFDWNVDYKHTTKKEGEEFTISGQLSSGSNTTDFENEIIGSPFPAISSNNIGRNKEYTAQTDYTYPFSKSTILEVGAKGIFRNINSEFSNNTAQDFEYSQDVASAYGVISFKLNKKLNFKGGLRSEYTAIDFNTAQGGTQKNDYFNLFPSAIISQTLKGNATLKLSYNRRVQRPSLAYLNPFRNESDQFNIRQGEPTLNPELSDNLELGYSTFIKGSVINASVFYRRTGGVIESSITPFREGSLDKTLTTYINVGTAQTYGANLFGSYNPKPKWTLMTNLGVNTYEVSNTQTGVSTGTFLNYNIFGRSAYGFGKGYNFELFGVVNSPRRTYQGKTDAMVFYGASFKKDILNKKGSIGINTLNPFTRDLHIKTVNNSVTNVGNKVSTLFQSSNIYYPLRSFGVNFSYSFGKLKFTEKKKIKNDDVKQDQQQGGGMGGGLQQ